MTETEQDMALVTEPAELSDDELVAAVGSAAGVSARWQCRLLLLAAEVDRRELWAGWGMSSAAAWLSWRCGLDLVTAREHLRVGRALERLPLVREAFEQGRLSYSKVRAVTRVATEADEQGWVDTAVDLPAAELVRLTRACRKASTGPQEKARPSLRWSWDEDGMLRVSARLDTEAGNLLLAALRQADDALAQALPEPVDGPADASADASPPERGSSWLEALTLVSRASLAVGPRVRESADEYQLVLHVAEDRIHLQEGPGVPEPLARQIACDATVTAVVHGTQGQVLGMGRRTRRISGRLRRGVLERDEHYCRYPGCGRSRWLQVHHVVHWMDGGSTDPDNLLTLCSAHHRKLHERSYEITGHGEQLFTFSRADGTEIRPSGEDRLHTAPRATLHALPAPDAATAAGTWDGRRLDLDWAVAVIAANAELRRTAA
jgi:5-methylcytosine-specific restriction endonuclease McrA